MPSATPATCLRAPSIAGGGVGTKKDFIGIRRVQGLGLLRFRALGLFGLRRHSGLKFHFFKGFRI